MNRKVLPAPHKGSISRAAARKAVRAVNAKGSKKESVARGRPLGGSGKSNIWHIEPIGDLKPHVTDKGADCWCKPSVEEDGNLIIHNSLDQREKYERGELKPH